eukprot:XP_001709503.1 Hypothetical protein GL50803_38827 [Giardia lamblia ATCC 50803]
MRSVQRCKGIFLLSHCLKKPSNYVFLLFQLLLQRFHLSILWCSVKCSCSSSIGRCKLLLHDSHRVLRCFSCFLGPLFIV